VAEDAEKKEKTSERLVLEKKFWPFKVLDEAEQTEQIARGLLFRPSVPSAVQHE